MDDLLKQIGKSYRFPCKIAFVLIKEHDDSVAILSTEIKAKTQIDNVKYKHISKSTWTSKGSAVLSIGEYLNSEQYLSEHRRLTDIWGFALKKGI